MESKESFKTFAIHMVVCAAFFTGGLGISHLHRPTKNTGQVQIQMNDSHRVWFVRPDHEVFSTYFDNEFPFNPGVTLKNIVYTDAPNEHARFVKAQLP